MCGRFQMALLFRRISFIYSVQNLASKRISDQFIFRSKTTESFAAADAVVHSNGEIDEKIKKPLWFYNNKAIRKRKINQLLKQTSADIECLSEDASHLNRLIGTLEGYNFKKKDVGELLYIKPRLLELSKSKLQKRFTGFLILNMPRDTIKRMVMKCPSILLVDQEIVSLQKRLNFLQELPLHPRLTQEKCLYLAQKCPQLLLIDNKANLRSKIKNLSKFKLNPQQLYELIMKHPQVLTYSESAVHEKCKFLTEEMGAANSLLIKFPRVLSSSLQRILERYKYLIHEGYLSENSYISENKLRAIVLPTDNDFVYRVTNTKMKDFRAFQATVKRNDYSENIGNNIMDSAVVQNSLSDLEEFGSTKEFGKVPYFGEEKIL